MHHRRRRAARAALRTLLLGAVGLACIGPVRAEPGPTPTVQPGDHLRLQTARATLRRAIDALGQAPADGSAAQAAEQAMATIERLIDGYFHGAGLRRPERRAHVLDLRLPIAETISGPRAVMHLDGDVLRFRPAVHDRLAAAAEARGALTDAVRHRRAALASTPTDLKRLDALHVALLAAGERQAAARIVARMTRVKSAGQAPGEPAVSAPRGARPDDSR